MRIQRGGSILELTVACAILAVAAMTTSATVSTVRRSGLRTATEQVRALLELHNVIGQTKGTYRALKFTQRGNDWFYTVYEDGDGDGVTSSDISRGIDRRLEGPLPLLPPGSLATVGFPDSGAPDPDGGRPIPAGTRPVQFGVSNLCSFSEYGTCTPGTIFLTDGGSAAAMIRCSGAEGNIRVQFYGFGSSGWSH